MIWLIILGIGILLLILSVSMRKGEAMFGFGMAFTIISFLFSCVFIIEGVNIYPGLRGKQAEIKTLQNRVDSIREAYYHEKVPETALVGGSLTNIQQSSKLSEYLIKLAEKEAYYNLRLTEVKIYKTTTLFKLIGNGAFISEKVLEMK